jgi:molybdate transport system substrate-binding protein
MVWLLWAVMLIQAQQHRQLVIFAASSLTDAFEDIATAFEAEHPTVDILFNFGGSSTLAAQLNQGAPADIFASANPQQMTKAIDGGRIADDPQTFTQNRLVLIVPADNPANMTSIDDLARSGVLLVLAAPDVPARVYTDAMLDALAMHADYGEAYRMAVMANVVSEEPNVRQVAAKIAFGEADAGIVYHSDVTPDIADDVLVLPIPDAVNTTATYPIAITDDSPHPELAREFIDFVRAEDGQAILQAWGFLLVLMDDPPVRCMLMRQVD